jgi:hypothetical protein
LAAHCREDSLICVSFVQVQESAFARLVPDWSDRDIFLRIKSTDCTYD